MQVVEDDMHVAILNTTKDNALQIAVVRLALLIASVEDGGSCTEGQSFQRVIQVSEKYLSKWAALLLHHAAEKDL